MSFYRRSRPSTAPTANGRTTFCGYDTADTIADVVEAYKRTRTTKYFILLDGSPDLAGLTCSCGATLDQPAPDGKPDPGNRCLFRKVKGNSYVMGQHYVCSWGTLLTAIGTSSTVSEAGGKLQRAETKLWKKVAP